MLEGLKDESGQLKKPVLFSLIGGAGLVGYLLIKSKGSSGSSSAGTPVAPTPTNAPDLTSLLAAIGQVYNPAPANTPAPGGASTPTTPSPNTPTVPTAPTVMSAGGGVTGWAADWFNHLTVADQQLVTAATPASSPATFLNLAAMFSHGATSATEGGAYQTINQFGTQLDKNGNSGGAAPAIALALSQLPGEAAQAQAQGVQVQ